MIASLRTWLWPDGADLLARPRLTRSRWLEVVYAIGDVHGCLDQLRRLESLIVADACAYAGDKLIVMLGDYIDRGSNSAGVLDHLLSDPPIDFARVCLAGNYEKMMTDFIKQPRVCPNGCRCGFT